MEGENSFLFCSDCQMDYSNMNSYRKHMRKRHPTKLEHFSIPKKNEMANFFCDICNQCFNTARSLGNHRKSCFFQSAECETDSKVKMRRIIDDENIACSDCELEFDDLTSFKQHMRDHRDNRINKVEKMKTESETEQKLKSTRKSSKQSEPANQMKEKKNHIPSPIYNQSSPRKSARNKKPISYAHLINNSSDSENEVHNSTTDKKRRKSGEKHFCNQCNMEYQQLKDLQKHIRKHHPSKIMVESELDEPKEKVKSSTQKLIKCETCLTKYSNLKNLKTHMEKCHLAKSNELAQFCKKNPNNGENIYTCPKCKTIYRNIIGLRKHMRKFHNAQFNELIPILYKTKQENKNWSCKECQVSYSSLVTLRKHVKKNHPTKLLELIPILYKRKFANLRRDIACSECDMKYSNMGGLRKHTRKHHPNKLIELAPLLYTFKRNMAKNLLGKRRNLKDVKIESLIDLQLIDLEKYKCSICQSSYSNSSNLRKHVRKFHPNKISDIAPLLRKDSYYQYPCGKCPKNFNCLRNFKHHQRKCHSDITKVSVQSTKPSKINKCPLCSFEDTDRKKLLQHFKSEHDIEVNMMPVEVTTLDEFSKWKDKFEKETNTRFVKEYHFSCNSHDVISYICHRSGYYNPKGKGLRHMKAQGSSKINGYCPAAMKLKKMKDNTVRVTYCGTHIGHTTDVNHLHLTPSERQLIAEKIALNIPFNEILKTMKDSASEQDSKRIRMLSKKDLYNIKSSFNLMSPTAKIIKPPSESISFEVWIEDMKKMGDCIMFHKQKGKLLPEHPNLKPEDFVLMIMNQTQREKMKKFGHDTVCIDRSLDLNHHHFELISLLILNDTQEGFPCAFLVSNRSDREILTLFFHYIKTYVGGIDTKVFMSDMVDYIFNAWTSIMPSSNLSLLQYCSWQIEHSWRKKVTTIKSKEKQEIVMSKLMKSLAENDISTFRATLECIASELRGENQTLEFSKYLTTAYVDNFELWHSIGETYKDIAYNQHLDRMHRTLRHLFLNGKNSKHFGKALGDIMRFLKDKLFDRTILMNRGKINNKMKIAIFRHKLSLHTKSNEVTVIDGGWLIPSSDNSGETYRLIEIQPSCRCEFICPECKSCVHRYVCSCLDSSVKWNMCMHIHLLCRFLNSQENNQNRSERSDVIVQLSQTTKPDMSVKQTNVSEDLIIMKQVPQIQITKRQFEQSEFEKEADQQVEFIKQQPQQIEFIKQQVEFVKQQPQQIELIKQQPQRVEFMKQLQQVEFMKQQTHQVEFIKHPHHIEYIKQIPIEYGKEHEGIQFIKQQAQFLKSQAQVYIKQPQDLEHVQVQQIQVGNHMDQVEGTYIYCNEANQREMDAILAEVNICNLETVQVTEIPTNCTIQIPSTCTVVPQIAECSSYGEIVDTKESLKMKFSKLLEEASSPSELEVVQKMLASITPTLEVIKGGSNNQVIFPL